VSIETAYRIQARSCGVGLNPSVLDDNAECLLCGHCLKACDQNSPGIEGRPNPGWFPRPWAKDLRGLKPLTAPQAAFLLIVSGFVIYEVLSEWGASKAILLHVPQWLRRLTVGAGKNLAHPAMVMRLTALPPWLYHPARIGSDASARSPTVQRSGLGP
jgi:hypothetical protein